MFWRGTYPKQFAATEALPQFRYPTTCLVQRPFFRAGSLQRGNSSAFALSSLCLTSGKNCWRHPLRAPIASQHHCGSCGDWQKKRKQSTPFRKTVARLLPPNLTSSARMTGNAVVQVCTRQACPEALLGIHGRMAARTHGKRNYMPGKQSMAS